MTVTCNGEKEKSEVAAELELAYNSACKVSVGTKLEHKNKLTHEFSSENMEV